jgi:hypothetical protein
MPITGFFLLLLPLGLWAYQCLMWLRNGVWTPLPIELIWRYYGFADPDLQWKGVQIIAAGLLDLPIALVSILIACIVAFPEAVVHAAWARWNKKINSAIWTALGMLGLGLVAYVVYAMTLNDWLELLSAVAVVVAIYGVIGGGPWLLYIWMTRRPVDFEKLNKSLQRDRERVLKSMRRSEG